MMRARIRQKGKDAFFEAITKAVNSDFLKGQNQKNWSASFDWIIKPTNFEKILSGNYDNKHGLTYDESEFVNRLINK